MIKVKLCIYGRCAWFNSDEKNDIDFEKYLENHPDVIQVMEIDSYGNVIRTSKEMTDRITEETE